MKHLPVFMVIALFLAACQAPAATATAVPPLGAPTSAAPKPAVKASATVSVAAPPDTPAPTAAPVVHSSSSDPNAPNLIVVRDQPVTNSSVTIDSVTAAQTGWLVVYMEKKGQPGHQIGFAPVPSGRSKQVAIRLSMNVGADITLRKLVGQQLYVVLQSGGPAPGKPVQVQGRSILDAFTILPSANP